MEIVLLRHGKPSIQSLNRLSASAFREWVRAYDASGLSVLSKPTNEALACADDCHVIICSQLPRSIESANALNSEKVILSDSIFNEAGLPFASWHTLKLPPRLWAVFFRVLWLLGYSRHSESYEEAKARATKAVKKLVELAVENGKVLLVGHGVFNRLLANELRNRGWVGPKSPGSKHWSYGVYER